MGLFLFRYRCANSASVPSQN